MDHNNYPNSHMGRKLSWKNNLCKKISLLLLINWKVLQYKYKKIKFKIQIY